MNGFLNKNLKSYAKNWLAPVKYAEMQSKNAVRNQYTNLYAYAANNPVHYIDPDGKMIIASRNAIRFFNDKNNGLRYITNSYNLSQYELKSNIAYYNKYGKKQLLSSYGNLYKTKEQLNQAHLGITLFSFFKRTITNFENADKKNVFFESKLIEDKFDDNGNQYYELSISINGEKTRLFYYSKIEARNEEHLKQGIGEFFSLFKEGTKDDWIPAKDIKIIGDTPYN